MALRDKRFGGFATGGTSFGTFPSFGQSTFDLNTPQGLLDLAMLQDGAVAEAAFELIHPEKSMLSQIGSGLMNTFAGFIDIITIPEQVIAGMIDPDISIGEAIEENIRPSDVLFGEVDEEMSAMTKVGGFFIRTATDILLDPLTYVSFGARAGAQAIQVAGKKKFLTETGEELLQKRIQNQIKGLTRYGEILGKTKKLEGEALEQLVRETIGAELNPQFTKKAMGNLLARRPRLARKFIDKGGIKVFGNTLLSAQRIDSAIRMIPGFTYLDNFTRPLRNLLGSTFNRNIDAKYGALPQEFIDGEQMFRDLNTAKLIRGQTSSARFVRENKMTSIEAKDLMHSIEKGKIPIDPRSARLWRELKGVSKEHLGTLRKAGFKVHEQINHMPHIMVKEKVTVLPFRLPPKTSGKFAQSRRMIKRSVKEINEAIGREFFDPNAVSALAKRGAMIDHVVTMKDFVEWTAENYGVVKSQAPEGFVKASVQGMGDEIMDLASFVVGKDMEELRFHPAIAKRIETFSGALINDEATNIWLKEIDSMQRMWKASVTSMFPMFHGRNGISNVLQNYLDLGLGAIDPARHSLSVDLMMKNRKTNQLFDIVARGGKAAGEATEELNELLLKEVFTDRNGYKWTFGELRTTIQNHQIAFNPNLTGAMDIRVSNREFVSRLFPETSKLGVAKKIPGKIFEKGRQVGNLIENQARLVNFLTHLQKTGDPVFAAQRTKQFLFDYQNLSNFEKTFMRRIIPFYTWCLPVEESPILTKNGWVYANDLEIGTEVLTYNKDNDYCEWQPVKDKKIFDYDNEITELSNKRHTFRFTPNHRWVVRRNKTIVKGKEYGGEIIIKKGYELNTNDSIKIVSSIKNEKESILTPKQASLLGWLLTDGYFRNRKHSPNNIEAVIYQHPKKYLEEVIMVAGGKPRKPHPESGVVCVPVLLERIKEIKHLLKRDKKSDNWIDVVTSLSKESAQAMYDAMYMADGTTTPNREYDFFACQLDGVGKTFEVLATLLGKRTSKSSRGYSVSDNQILKIAGTKSKNVHYTGRVWCPITKNGTWVTKQGNIITITGNTRKNLELQARALIKTPGRVVAQVKAFQNLGEVFGAGELSKEDKAKLPQWAVDGFSILKGKKGETVEILANLGTPLEQTFQFFQPGKFLGSISPFIRVPLELASGYNFFQQKPLSEVTNAAAFKRAPDVVKDFIGFTEISGKRKDGTPYTWYISLRPSRLHLLLNLPPTSRVLSSLKQIEAVDVPQGSKILQQLVGVRPFTFDLEREEEKRERELKKQLEQLLINAGTVSKFERTFIPKSK